MVPYRNVWVSVGTAGEYVLRRVLWWVVISQHAVPVCVRDVAALWDEI